MSTYYEDVSVAVGTRGKRELLLETEEMRMPANMSPNERETYNYSQPGGKEASPESDRIVP